MPLLALLCVAQLMVILDISAVNVALPDLAADLGIARADVAWTITSYSLLFGSLLLLGGRAADLLGRRRVFLFGLLVFTLSSLGSALAGDAGVLFAARAGQGLGAAMLSPAALSIIVRTFAEGRERTRALGAWGAVGGAGAAIGVLLGGALTALVDWRAIFLINLPVGLALAGRRRARIVPADAEPPRRRGLDLRGAVLATAGFGALVYAFSRRPTPAGRRPRRRRPARPVLRRSLRLRCWSRQRGAVGGEGAGRPGRGGGRRDRARRRQSALAGERQPLILDQVAVPAAVARARVRSVGAEAAAARRRAARRADAGELEHRAVAGLQVLARRTQMTVDHGVDAALRRQREAPADLREQRLRRAREVVAVADEPLDGRLARAQHVRAVGGGEEVVGQLAVDLTAYVVHGGALLILRVRRGSDERRGPAEPRGRLRRDRLGEERDTACSIRTDKSKTTSV